MAHNSKFSRDILLRVRNGHGLTFQEASCYFTFFFLEKRLCIWFHGCAFLVIFHLRSRSSYAVIATKISIRIIGYPTQTGDNETALSRFFLSSFNEMISDSFSFLRSGENLDLYLASFNCFLESPSWITTRFLGGFRRHYFRRRSWPSGSNIVETLAQNKSRDQRQRMDIAREVEWVYCFGEEKSLYPVFLDIFLRTLTSFGSTWCRCLKGHGCDWRST